MNDDIGSPKEFPIPGAAWFERSVNQFTKKAFATLWGDIKRHLTTAAEPFHRKHMGERYYSQEAIGGGITIWSVSWIANLMLVNLLRFFSSERSSFWEICNFVVMVAMIGATAAFGSLDIAHAQQCRNRGKPFHSRSRGIPRWGAYNPFVLVGLSLLLLFFSPVTGIAFLASLHFASKIAAEQQAAIFSRYLDAVDQKIEEEHLESAILGEYPIEETFLHKILPVNIPTELRRDIAAAAVGKPVKIVSKRPQTPESNSSTNDSKPKTGTASEAAQAT